MTGKQLREALRLLGYTQAELAADVKRSQKAVSLWVTGSGNVPEDVEERITVLLHEKLRDRAPEALRQIAQPQIESNVHSWPAEIFNLLWKDADKRKRVRQVEMEAAISPAESGFANCDIWMRFHELELGPNERFYLDHLGIRASSDDESNDRATEWEPPPRLEGAERTQLTVDKDISDPKRGLGPHAIAYELSNADRLDRVTVALRARRAVRLGEFDAIGFPLYGDLVVERLMVQVRFVGLEPEPDPPIAQTYLIRRTTSRPSGLVSDLEPPLRERQADGLRYTFGPLLRPRNGYVYCLSWAKLRLSETSDEANTP